MGRTARLAFGVLLLASCAVHGQPFPSKPIRLVVPGAAGGFIDGSARTVARQLSTQLGQEVIVQNVPGPPGTASAQVAAAPRDGYTLLMGSTVTHSVPVLTGTAPYDPLRDFAPVASIARVPSVLVVPNSLPVNSVAELIAYGKANRDPLGFGSTGRGSQSHLAGELFRDRSGISMTHIPYKGSAPAIDDLREGRINVYFDTLLSALPGIREGRVRPLAVTSGARVSTLPDVPTVAEAGLRDYEATTWLGVLAPRGTPAEVVEALNRSIRNALESNEVRGRLLDAGVVVTAAGTPREFEQVIVADLRKWARIVRGPTASAKPPPPPPPPPSEPIFYNADLVPQLPRDPAAPNRPVLQAGQSATLRFAIGPKWKSSVIPDVTPSADILLSKDDLPLTVVLACSFCEPHADSLKRMTFMPRERRSDEIRFQFTPQRRQNRSAYVDKLQLSVVNDATGREYDRIVIDVAVSDTAAAPDRTAPDSPLAFQISRGEGGGDWRPDVLLYATAEAGGTVSIAIEPVSVEMRRRLSLALDAQGVRRTFRSGIDDAKMVEAMTTSAYGVMSAVGIQGQLLKRLSASGTDAAVSTASQESLLLTDTESKNVTGAIADIGQRLYRHLFVSPDRDLRLLIQQLEAAAADAPRDRPLRLLIYTDKISLPWQYLHPVGPEVDAEKFWGLRFSLSVLRVNTGARVSATATAAGKTRKVVFARYGSSADPTVPLANEQKQQLRKLPVAEGDLVEVDNGSDLLANLEQRRREISAIFAFLHAASSSGDAEPHLSFNEGDIVTSDVLERLLNKLTMEEQDTRYLASAPLVVLNACETGPSVNLPHVSLQNVMFQLGAQGVVVTEVSVWIRLGHDMATRLVKRLGSGEAIGDALTAIRRDLYAERKNPLGLLYVYYGDPGATLRF